MKRFIENVKHLPTTLAGIGGVLALLPQDSTVQTVMGLSPRAAHLIAGVGALGTALALIFGTGAKQQ